ncbi:hypothetical protein HHK36_005213 [Tetracentron sinense]|uniref:Trichome birefringence-like C-terminal domain-containing protein n=1 Tax=Tetracentron sinense TaxID=13715 RepID=A0A834ZNZ1_TETSI|nr:hypothetical protein HHK36_005213 [Tetracentron sinense]
MQDYDVSLLFSRNAFLVDMIAEEEGVVLKLDSLASNKTWEAMDTLIFNTWHWWLHTGRKQPWKYIQYGNSHLLEDMDRLVAYRKALTTWANWVKSTDTTKTRVFFQGISPDHLKGGDWHEPGKNCSGQTEPLFGSEYPGGPHPAAIVVDEVLSDVKEKVYLLNVTTLSQLRKDGHPSYYVRGHSVLDCSHWCLAGVPDTWNHLLYAALFTQ